MTRAVEVCGALLFALALPACSAEVLDPSDESPSGGAVGVASNALAMRFSDWTLPSNAASMFQLSLVSGTPDPDALVLFYASRAQSCAQPHIEFEGGIDPAVCQTQQFWQAILVLPPERTHPGIIDLHDPSIFAYRATWLPECGGGSSSSPGIDGSLTITGIDAASVVTTLDLDPTSGFITQNGDYTATFCP